MASRPFDASATSFISDCVDTSAAIPSRRRGWSSTVRIRIGLAFALMPRRWTTLAPIQRAQRTVNGFMRPWRLLAAVERRDARRAVAAPAAEPEGLEPHRLESDVAGEDHEVGPGNLPAILLLDRPEQPARLVEVD